MVPKPSSSIRRSATLNSGVTSTFSANSVTAFWKIRAVGARLPGVSLTSLTVMTRTFSKLSPPWSVVLTRIL